MSGEHGRVTRFELNGVDMTRFLQGDSGGEKWLPIRHDRKVTVELDPPAHRATVKDGKTYGIRTVRIVHRIEYNGPGDPEWRALEPILIAAGGAVFAASELRERPAWLESIIARAEPVDP